MAISTEDRDRFFSEGMLRLDLELDASDLSDAIADMAAEQQINESSTYQPGSRVQDGWKKSEAVKRIATHPSALKVLRELFGREALPFQTLNFPVGTQQKVHSDTVHFNSIPSGFVAGIWVALEDVDADNGPLIYYPGSHKLPEYDMRDVSPSRYGRDYTGYEKFIEDKILELRLEPKLAHLKRGEAVIWHANLWHGGSAVLDPARTRHSQVTHYFFEGCRYFTPVNSTPDYTEWRYPEFVDQPKIVGLLMKIWEAFMRRANKRKRG